MSTQIETNTDEVGQVMLAQYNAGHGSGTFLVSVVDPPVGTDPPPPRGVTLTYEDGFASGTAKAKK